MTTSDAELLAAAGNPTAAWLESCFGPGTLWRPAPGELPERLTSPGARAFLSEVGVPAVELDFVGFDATGLPERGMWEADLDELFGERTPDDDTPPSNWGYCVGTFGERHLMVAGDSGAVRIYNPDGWDHGDGYGGWAADSLPALVGALALLARLEERIREGDAKAALDEFAVLLRESGQGPDDSDLWDGLLENLRDEYQDED
ncbi:SUKH-4 family immunity protein [Kitasatospora brasiliensis]|uniref:SUKH-4 family immunity protein n=1 Tax=Kitasatospora brasiliensis TaxID=3058040 RepID=UPI0029313E5E|nr:SUKH-4 family immunity protein [Kitasatospora sp. K002]